MGNKAVGLAQRQTNNCKGIATWASAGAICGGLLASGGGCKRMSPAAYIKDQKRQFFHYFFTIFFGIFWVPREAALAADLITA